MTFTRREKLLALIAASLLAVIALRFVYSWAFGEGRKLRALRARLVREVNEKQRQLDQTREIVNRLAEYRRRSLPENIQLAQTLYGTWLLELADKAGFDDKVITSSQARRRQGPFASLSFTLQGRARLEEIAQFLYSFYSTGYLHKIRLMSLQPIRDSSQLEVRLTIEALAVENALAKDRLPEATGNNLVDKDRDAYVRLLAERNFFRPYRPSPPQRPSNGPSMMAARPSQPAFDLAKFTVLTAIAGNATAPEAWLLCRPTGKRYRLKAGDSFSVGSVSGTVRRVGLREAEIEVAGHTVKVRLGENLRDAIGQLQPAAGQVTEASSEKRTASAWDFFFGSSDTQTGDGSSQEATNTAEPEENPSDKLSVDTAAQADSKDAATEN